MSCSSNTYNLGCFCSCDTISIGEVPESGTYKFIFSFGNIKQSFNVVGIIGQPFEFDLSQLNENANYTFYVMKDGVKVPLIVNDNEYFNFSLKTEIILGCGEIAEETFYILTEDSEEIMTEISENLIQ